MTPPTGNRGVLAPPDDLQDTWRRPASWVTPRGPRRLIGGSACAETALLSAAADVDFPAADGDFPDDDGFEEQDYVFDDDEDEDEDERDEDERDVDAEERETERGDVRRIAGGGEDDDVHEVCALLREEGV